jgi:putative transposase
MLQDRFGVSERRACKVVGQHRSTQRAEPPSPPGDEAELREFLRVFARRRPRWGWRRAAKELRRSGRPVNNKRVRRLWRDEGLQVPTKTKKKRLTGVGTHVGAMSLIAPNALWALDFQFDHTIDHRQMKMLNVIDEFTANASTSASITPSRLTTSSPCWTVSPSPVAALRRSSGSTTAPSSSRSWSPSGAQPTAPNACSSTPGSPWQNAWIESFNSRLRDELLNLWQFDSLLEAQVLIGDWRIDYNENRPHSAHGNLTPSEFAKAWTNTQNHQPQAA